MAINNHTLQDEDGDYSDWIELFNSGSTEVNLGGWLLTDNPDSITKWMFPDVTMAPGEYLVVFASGKDRKAEKDKLHTNFKLSGSGEFLGLLLPGGSQYVSVFTPTFFEQYADVSYGSYQDTYLYYSNPTPGAENSGSLYLTAPVFSIGHSYYKLPFDLELSCNADEADIYYTTDASIPSSTNGTKYSGPIHISTTTVVRAVAIRAGVDTSITVTQSYIFAEDVIHQSDSPAGYPETWLSPVHGTDDYFEIPGNYGMIESFVNRSDVQSVFVQSLLSLPVVSIVSDIDNFFSKSLNPDSGGIYMYNGEPDGPTRDLRYHLGKGWVRPASVEYFNSNKQDGHLNFQANCCIKIHGGACRTRAKTEKHSFSIGFKSNYGPPKLDEQLFGKGSPKQYDWLILRGGFDRRLGQQIRDPYGKSTLSDMGQYAARSKFVHVYLNGMYWGMYNLSERMDDNCMRDNLGGKAGDYDILKDYFEVESGDTIVWSKLVEMAGDNIENEANYQKLLGNNPDHTPNPAYEKMVNDENLIDYVMMNIYAGTTDWDHHNWVAARRRTNSDGFHFLAWDVESILMNVSELRVYTQVQYNRPSGIFYDLIRNDTFKNLFISHVNKHFFEGGALTPKPCLERYEKWLANIDTALIADQARWWVDPNDIWNTHYHTFIYNYFPRRTEIVFNQLISAGLYPAVSPPEFNTDKNIIPEEFQLLMSSPDGGEIRYSLDGTDPGYFSPVLNKSILIYDNNPLPLKGDTVLVQARVKKDTLWSKLVTRQFLIGDEVNNITDNHKETDGYLYCYPNPVQDQANIVFSLSEASEINLTVYNVMGKQVANIYQGTMPVGSHSVSWNTGSLPAGVFVCILTNNSTDNTYRIRIIKK